MLPRYQEWLRHVFDRPSTPNGWYFDVEDSDFEAEHQEIVKLVAYTLEHCKTDLAKFSEDQVNDGLNFIFNNSCSNTVFSLKDQSVSVEDRLKVLTAIKILYRDCFSIRCAQVLSHVDEPGSNPLNSICYMLWDISPIARWENDSQKPVFYRAVVDVMSFGLSLENPACIESALHGLGHTQSYYPEGAAEAIASFLKKHPNLSPQIKSYANNALIGYVQ